LPPTQHRALAEIASQEGRSMSDVVREMVQQSLDQREQQYSADVARRLAALERIRQHREEILARRGGKPLEFDVVEAINQMRDERDDHITADQRLVNSSHQAGATWVHWIGETAAGP